MTLMRIHLSEPNGSNLIGYKIMDFLIHCRDGIVYYKPFFMLNGVSFRDPE